MLGLLLLKTFDMSDEITNEQRGLTSGNELPRFRVYERADISFQHKKKRRAHTPPKKEIRAPDGNKSQEQAMVLAQIKQSIDRMQMYNEIERNKLEEERQAEN